MDKETRRQIASEIDMILRLEARANEAALMGFPEISDGARDDAKRRRALIRSITYNAERFKK